MFKMEKYKTSRNFDEIKTKLNYLVVFYASIGKDLIESVFEWKRFARATQREGFGVGGSGSVVQCK